MDPTGFNSQNHSLKRPSNKLPNATGKLSIKTGIGLFSMTALTPTPQPPPIGAKAQKEIKHGIASRFKGIFKKFLASEKPDPTSQQLKVSETISVEDPEMLRKLTGPGWNCVEKRQIEGVGTAYVFEIASGDDGKDIDIVDLNNKIYPAVVPVDIFQFFKIFTLKDHSTENLSLPIEMIELGYGYEKGDEATKPRLILPDADTLNAQLKILNEKRKEAGLPEIQLKIKTSKDIASHQDFIEAFLNGYLLISLGKEFLHDHTAHVAQSFNLYLKGDSHDLLRDLVRPMYEAIKDLKNEDKRNAFMKNHNIEVTEEDIAMLTACLSYIIDLGTNKTDPIPRNILIFNFKNGNALYNEKFYNYMEDPVKGGHPGFRNRINHLMGVWSIITLSCY